MGAAVCCTEEKDIVGAFIAKMPPDNTNAIYDTIDGDSNVEKVFAEDLAQRRDVRLFLKLPSWFQVPTPVGRNYNPDWAILLENETLIFIAETKSAVVNKRIQFNKLRPDEGLKNQSARRANLVRAKSKSSTRIGVFLLVLWTVPSSA